MKLSEHIKLAQQMLEEHGDHDLLSDSYFPVFGMVFRVAEKGQFPDDWDMPAGYKFYQLRVVD